MFAKCTFVTSLVRGCRKKRKFWGFSTIATARVNRFSKFNMSRVGKRKGYPKKIENSEKKKFALGRPSRNKFLRTPLHALTCSWDACRLRGNFVSICVQQLFVEPTKKWRLRKTVVQWFFQKSCRHTHRHTETVPFYLLLTHFVPFTERASLKLNKHKTHFVSNDVTVLYPDTAFWNANGVINGLFWRWAIAPLKVITPQLQQHTDDSSTTP